MIHPVALLVTGMLTAMVAIALTALCAAWTVPAWRRRLLVAWYGCYWSIVALLAGIT